MKDYYRILGVKEDASEEEVREHWIALMRRFHPDRQNREEANPSTSRPRGRGLLRVGPDRRFFTPPSKAGPGAAERVKNERVEEINEAYEVLKYSSTRVKYDLERAHVRRKRAARLRRRSLGIGIFVILILGIVLLTQPRVPLQPGPKIQNEMDPRKQMSGGPVPSPPHSPSGTAIHAEQGVPGEVPQVSEKVISDDMRKLEEPGPAPPEIFSPSKSGKTAETEEIIFTETDRMAGQENPRVVSQEMRERVGAKATIVEEPRVSSSVVPRTNEISVRDLTVAKRSIEGAPARGILSDLPTEVKGQTISPPAPSSVSQEKEVRQFFFDYVDRYNRMDLDGFLSLFSARALQNQKDGLEGIKKTYARFFGESRELRYLLEDAIIGTYPNGVEVKASYEVGQRLKKGGQKKVWRGHIRWILAREDGVFKVIFLDYQHHPSP